MAQSMAQVAERIVKAQTAANTEIANLAAALGLPTPKLAATYVATQYEQIAVHLETTAKGLAELNQAYAESQAPAADDTEEDSSETTAARPAGRKARTATTAAPAPESEG
jgi:hypothetical protein